MTSCHQDICPHLHFNKCYAQRIRSIPVSIFPDPTIDSFTNVNVKCGKQYKSNIPTVAYEKYSLNLEAPDNDRNFMKDFYMQNYQKDKMILNNNIVNEVKQQMYKNSAYVLAQSATKDYQEFEEKRVRALNNARNRAKTVYRAHVYQKKEERQKDYQQNGYWLKKLFRKLQQVAKHIIGGSGQDALQREKQFLLSKSNLTASFLSQIKIRAPKNACDILEELRILMQKKKLKFADLKEEQQLNQSVTQSFASEASQNTSQNSMLSEATSLNETNALGQDQIVSKFWDFNQLKKKWKLSDIQAVKQMIRRVLTKKIVFDAQLEAVKKRKQANQINRNIIKASSKQDPQPKDTAKQDKKSGKVGVSQQRNRVKSTIVNRAVQNAANIKLTKAEQLAKTTLIQGGRFDAMGQKFSRNRTYSQMFITRQNEIKTVYVQKELPKNTQYIAKENKFQVSTKISVVK